MPSKVRYPGVGYFDSYQNDIFFGRKNEVKKLKTLIKIEQKILLYSNSGIGKTSLLLAGVIPELPEKYEIIFVKFGNYNDDLSESIHRSPLETIFKTISKKYENIVSDNNLTAIENLIDSNTTKTLWFYLKKLQCQKTDKIFLFVFDQFEELFTYPTDNINQFVDQFQELFTNSVPDIYDLLIEERSKKSDNYLGSDEYCKIAQSMETKVLFSIRKDQLSEINQLTRKIPDIQNVFYELLPLSEDQAEEAITNPAMVVDDDEDFGTPTFDYNIDALKKITNELTSAGQQTIESTQLQIVCKSIEDHLIEKIKVKPITQSLIKGFEFKNIDNKYVLKANNETADFKDIFKKFYDEAINLLPENVQLRVRCIIEDNLIKNEKRIPQDVNFFREQQIKEEWLNILVKAHLLRKENYASNRISYELIHDTLIKLVLDDKKEREKKEYEERILREAIEKAERDKTERERELKHHEDLLGIEKESTRKAKKHARTRLILSIILAITTIGSIFFAHKFYFEKIKARKGEMVAKKKEEVATNKKDTAEYRTEKAKENSESLQATLNDLNPVDQEKSLMEIKRLIETGDSKTAILKINGLIGKYDSLKIENIVKFNKLYVEAKEFENIEEYWPKAIAIYDSALRLNVPNLLAKERSENLQNRINSKVKQYEEYAEKYIAFGKLFKPAAYDRFIKPGLKLDPNNTKLKELENQANSKNP